LVAPSFLEEKLCDSRQRFIQYVSWVWFSSPYTSSPLLPSAWKRVLKLKKKWKAYQYRGWNSVCWWSALRNKHSPIQVDRNSLFLIHAPLFKKTPVRYVVLCPSISLYRLFDSNLRWTDHYSRLTGDRIDVRSSPSTSSIGPMDQQKDEKERYWG
jgi:hypothetical protein